MRGWVVGGTALLGLLACLAAGVTATPVLCFLVRVVAWLRNKQTGTYTLKLDALIAAKKVLVLALERLLRWLAG